MAYYELFTEEYPMGEVNDKQLAVFEGFPTIAGINAVLQEQHMPPIEGDSVDVFAKSVCIGMGPCGSMYLCDIGTGLNVYPLFLNELAVYNSEGKRK